MAGQEGHGLLLRRTPYGESSLVVHVLTERHGRIELIAKGAHRPKSRFSGVLDWFDTLELSWTVPRASSGGRRETARLWTLVRGDLHLRRRRITRSLGAYRAGQTMVELLDIATRAGFADAEMFGLAEEGLGALDRESLAAGDAQSCLAAFELHLLRTLGLAPALDVCASCGGPAETVRAGPGEIRAMFSAQAGGRLCARHAEAARATGLRVGTLPMLILELAGALLHRPIGQAGEVLTNENGLAERVLDFAGRFLDHHLGVRPRSHREFLDAPDRNRRQRQPSSSA